MEGVRSRRIWIKILKKIENQKRQKNSADQGNSDEGFSDSQNLQNDVASQDLAVLKDKVQKMNAEFLVFLREKAEEIMDLAVDNTLDVLADQVMAEDEVMGEVSANVEPSKCELENTSAEDPREEISVKSLTLSLLNKGVARNNDILKAAAIPEALVSSPRASPRLVKSADVHVLQKAERRVAEKNLEGPEGNGPDLLLFNLDKNYVVSIVLNLGVHAQPEAVNLLCKNVCRLMRTSLL